MKTKICKYCKKFIENPISNRQEYHKNCMKKRKKEYIKEYRKEDYIKNKNEILNQRKVYYSRNKDIIKERQKNYNKLLKVKKRMKEYHKKYRQKNLDSIKKKRNENYWKNPIKARTNSSEYYYKNKDRILKQCKKYGEIYRIKNKQKRNEREKKRRNIDKNYNIRCRLRTRLWLALNKYTKKGKIRKADEYGINYKDIIEYLKPFPKNLNKYHIDHIKPLCNFDLTKSEEIKRAFIPENHQWLTIQENLIKNNKF